MIQTIRVFLDCSNLLLITTALHSISYLDCTHQIKTGSNCRVSNYFCILNCTSSSFHFAYLQFSK